jgi:hypothetical protein
VKDLAADRGPWKQVEDGMVLDGLLYGCWVVVVRERGCQWERVMQTARLIGRRAIRRMGSHTSIMSPFRCMHALEDGPRVRVFTLRPGSGDVGLVVEGRRDR